VWSLTLTETTRRSGPTAAALFGGAGAAAFALRRRAWPWAAALGTLTPFLLVWSQRRHFAVLLPIAWIGLAAGLGALARHPRASRAVGPVALGLVAAAALATLRPGAGKPPTERPAIERQLLAAQLARLPGSWALGGHDHDVNLYLGWTRNTVPADISATSGTIFRLEVSAPEKSAANVEYFRQRLLTFFTDCDRQLADHEYLAGGISVADLMLYPNYAARRALIESAGGFAHLNRWAAAMAARPGVQRGMSAGT
jgi:hypothetical protein